MRAIKLLTVFLVLFDLSASSQNFLAFGNQNFEVQAHYGFMMPHRQRIGYLNQRNVSGIEFTWAYQVKGNKPWHGLFNYPQKGVSLYYFNLSSKQHFGYGLGILPHINFPIGEKRRLGIKVGYGLGYIQKPFEIKGNYKNLVIGSKINVMFNTGINYRWNLSESLLIKSGLSLIHFSNGAFKLPNLGINNLTASLGISYSLNQHIVLEAPIEEKTEIKWEHFAFASFSVKEIDILSEKKYSIINVNSDALKKVSDKLVLGGGIDFSYNNSLVHSLAGLDENYEINNSDNIRAGVHGSIGLKIGRNYFLLQSGVYLRNKQDVLGPMYQRLVSRFAITDNLFATFTLKSHFAVADYFEAGIGYRF